MTVYLDTGVVLLLLSPGKRHKEVNQQCVNWYLALLDRGHDIFIPDVVYHEAERGYLITRRKHPHTKKLQALKALVSTGGARRLSITSRAIDHASILWAYLRLNGIKVSENSFDADVMIAAQIRQHRVRDHQVIATTNVRHLERMVNASSWQDIKP